MDLEQKVKKWHASADRLLRESGLAEVLGKYGEVVFTGSYHYNLILSPDIDIYLVVDEPTRQQSAKILDQLIEAGWWQNYELGDFLDKRFRIPKWDWLPEAIYLQTKTDFEDERWKVDIWVMSAEEQKKRSWNDKLTNIPPEQRAAILELKNARIQKEIDCTVHQIYEAVLYRNIKTVKEFTVG